MDKARVEYERKAEVQLNEWSKRIKGLKPVARKSGKPRIEQQIQALDLREQEARAKLEEFKQADDTAWKDLKLKLDSSLTNLRRATQDIVINLNK